MIVAGEFCTPGGVGNADQGEAEIDRGNPEKQIAKTHRLRGHEQHVSRQHHQRETDSDPRSSSSKAGSCSVAQAPDQRVGDDIAKPRDHEHQTNRREIQTQRSAVECWNVNRDRQTDDRKRHNHLRIGEKLLSGDPILRLHFLSLILRRFSHVPSPASDFRQTVTQSYDLKTPDFRVLSVPRT